MCDVCGKFMAKGQRKIKTPDNQIVTVCHDCMYNLSALYICENMTTKIPPEFESGNNSYTYSYDDQNPEHNDQMYYEREDGEQYLKTPSQILALLNEHIIGQDKAKKTIAVGIYNHYKRIMSNQTNIKKSNILMVGPTGTGKTEIARTIAEILDVPFAIADATTVTEAGYVGDDVENIILKLVQAADFDLDRAANGIIYIDEIDKIARKSESTSITRDVSGEGVQQALLKIIEGTNVRIPPNGGRKHPQQDCLELDTSNILFICGGAFESLTMTEKKTDNAFGFVDNRKKNENDIDAKMLIKQGMIPELIGRLPIIVRLEELTENDLARILIEPKNSIVRQYTDLLALDNATLNFDDKALSYIASTAIKNKTGARGLKSIIENYMTDIMFDVPDIESDNIEINISANENGLTKEIIDKTKISA